jgi:hypothetical protein
MPVKVGSITNLQHQKLISIVFGLLTLVLIMVKPIQSLHYLNMTVGNLHQTIL